MEDNNALKQLIKLDSDYNGYKISKEEALIRAKPLLVEYNKKLKTLAEKYKLKPKLINLKKFSFGR